MSSRSAHTVSWFPDKANSIILEPPPSCELYSRASGGVCRSRAHELKACTSETTPHSHEYVLL
ncbi:MAG: hypothetical protein U0K24_05655 [Lachnospiraceae bacterium]|nr:hypothetical protein [Lachnospiraceae bacterium]